MLKRFFTACGVGTCLGLLLKKKNTLVTEENYGEVFEHIVYIPPRLRLIENNFEFM